MAKNTQNTPLDSEQKKQHREEQARRAKRRTRQLLGLALAILIVIGAASIIRQSIQLVSNRLNDSSEKDLYTPRVTPLVWFNVLPFESPDKGDQNIMKEAVIWGIMNESGSEINRNENGEPIIPAAEVDRYAAELYGPDFKFTHETFTDTYQGLTYKYDESTQTYTAQAAGLTPDYLPIVMDIVRESGGKRVIVGYVSTTGSNDELISTPDFDHPTRFMDYFFRRDGSEYYLYSITPNLTYTTEAQAAAQSSSVPASQSEAIVEGFEDIENGASSESSSATSAASTSQSGADSSQETVESTESQSEA